MGTCPNCGKKKVFLSKVKCRICGRLGCGECFSFLFRVVDRNSAFDDQWYSCSETCFEKISSHIENHISPDEIVAEPKKPVSFFVEREILGQYAPKGLPGFMGQIMNRLDKKELYIAFNRHPESDPSKDSILWNRLAKYVQLIQASRFEAFKEFENAVALCSGKLTQLLNQPIYGFTEATSKQVPAQSGVYLIHDNKSKQLIYAGRSKNLRVRLLSQHKRGNIRGSQFRKALGQKHNLSSEAKISEYIANNCSFQLLTVESFEEMVRLEHFITAILAPILNTDLKQ